MKPLVKICGITNLHDALFCARAGADFIGFIFYMESARYIDPSKARGIIGKLPATATPVGVFVNAARTVIEDVIGTTGIRTIQLSGDEAPAECEEYPVEVWKAFRIRNERDVVITRRYRVAAAMLDGARDGHYGGTGEPADLAIAVKMKQFHPLVLAGGLKPENVASAVQFVRPFAIDVNSGVELTPGKKDHTKVTRLFEAVSMLE